MSSKRCLSALIVWLFLAVGCIASAVVGAADDSSSPPPPVVLSKDNFDEMTKDKTVFIKFYAPWCGHCQNLAPIWDEFRLLWTNHEVGLVAEVDCTLDAQSERWCSNDLGIVGFPTLLYGDPSHGGSFLVEYNGDKTLDVLSTFANETLTGPFCSPGNTDPCDKNVRRQIESYWKMTLSGLEKEIDKKENIMVEANRSFKKAFDRMQAQYDEHSRKHELAKAQISSNLKMLKSVKDYVSKVAES